MERLCNVKLIAHFVLVWFVLFVGVAVAAPIFKPEAMQLLCSGAGAMKANTAGHDGESPSLSLTLKCPLCAGIGAPPPLAILAFSHSLHTIFAPPMANNQFIFFALAAPPPARGPPVLS
jgi:hypothetical protein